MRKLRNPWLRNPWLLGIVACALALASTAWVLHADSDDHGDTCATCLHAHAQGVSISSSELPGLQIAGRVTVASTRPAAPHACLREPAPPRGPPHS